LKWLLEKLANIVFDVISGYILYLIVGGYISQPLSELHPYLPTLLASSLIITIIVGFFYRLYKSVKFHRFIERMSNNLADFLENWYKLRDTMHEAFQSRNQQAINEFEKVRIQLQYDYTSKDVASAVKIIKSGHVDPILGIIIRNYDVIGNLLMNSPFTDMQYGLFTDIIYKDFIKNWDAGKSIIVVVIGHFDKFRKTLTHKLYWILRLVPFPKLKETQNIS